MHSKKSKVIKTVQRPTSKVKRPTLAIAWDKWVDNQIKIINEMPSGIDLQNRLREAFEEGWNSATGGKS